MKVLVGMLEHYHHAGDRVRSWNGSESRILNSLMTLVVKENFGTSTLRWDCMQNRSQDSTGTGRGRMCGPRVSEGVDIFQAVCSTQHMSGVEFTKE